MAAPVISIYGPKGGVGKTVLASNFAFALAHRSKGKVLLIDLDPHDCGDIALLLGAQPTRSMADLAPIAHKLPPEAILKEAFHHPDGIWLLPAARQLKQMATLQPERVERLLALCRTVFDLIVIDTGSDVHPLALKAFEVSSLILFCTTSDILPLSRSVHSLAELKALALPSEMIQIVVNRFDPKGVISEGVLEQKLKRDCLALLPDESQALSSATQQGVPLIVTQPRASYSRVLEELARVVLTDGLLKIVTSPLKLSAPTTVISETQGSVISTAQRAQARVSNDEIDRQADIKLRIHQRLIEMMDFRNLSAEELMRQDERSIEDLRTKAREAIFNTMDRMTDLTPGDNRQQIAKEVLDEALALGPLEDLLADKNITEILVNRRDQIYVERKGKLSLTPLQFTSDKYLLGVIERIVAPIGRRIDEKSPMVDARLKDGSRVHAIIPPLALDGPMLTIRKFSRDIFTPDQLVKVGALNEEMADFLRACVQARLNIIVSGGTGSGKTTLLNVLAGFIPNDERILTVEDSAELRLPQEHVGRLESRPANLQGEGAIPIRELIRNTLRMRPDRIIVGECRGAEALDMLQAMNTGHDGSMTTIHANTPRDCVARLETLVMFSGLELPSRAIREQIASGIQLIVQLSRLSDGARKIIAITEVTGMESGNVQMQDLFLFKQKGLDQKQKVLGAYASTGLIPTFAERFKQRGIKLPKGMFEGS